MLDFESTLIDDLPDLEGERYLIAPHIPDYELGFLPLLASAIPMVANLAGSLLGKKDKSGAPAPEAQSAQDVLGILTKAIGGDESKGETSIKEVIRNIVATVPSPVLKQVKDGIKQLRDSDKATQASRDLIVRKVDSRFGPQLHAMLAAVKAGQLQKRATNEHNVLKARDAFRKNTAKSLKSISDRLTLIERRLAGAAVVRGEDRIRVLGGRSVLER